MPADLKEILCGPEVFAESLTPSLKAQATEDIFGKESVALLKLMVSVKQIAVALALILASGCG